MAVEQDDVPRDVLESNLADVRMEIQIACDESNRDPKEITMVAVTKTQSMNTIKTCLDLGLTIFGENRFQEMDLKKEELKNRSENITWHFIGQIQRNKVPRITAKADVIHSVDATWQIDVMAKIPEKPQLFLQLSADVKDHRGGVSFNEAPELLSYSRNHGRELTGVMIMPPLGEDPEPHFRACHDFAQMAGLADISMGMSQDYVQAIKCGSTVIRIGTALFGERRT